MMGRANEQFFFHSFFFFADGLPVSPAPAIHQSSSDSYWLDLENAKTQRFSPKRKRKGSGLD
jgi:hypothetical protein